tara:strand:- start:199 stop:363 length:165 start_codon:yes stop_codon:yes gene_type:complete
VEIIRLPIDDSGAPVPFQVPIFWKQAKSGVQFLSAFPNILFFRAIDKYLKRLFH